MRSVIVGWIVGLGISYASAGFAAPKRDVDALHSAAVALERDDRDDEALISIDAGLAIAPRDLRLLGLKGQVLLKQRDYAGALAAYEAYIAACATGANCRKAQKIVSDLRAVKSTFLAIALANGPATIYLGAKSRGVFCAAAPSCSKALLPGLHKVIAERSGFEPWSQSIMVAPDTTTNVAITLAEKPSLLTVRVTRAGAQVTVDGAAYDAPTKVRAGAHSVVVALAGHVKWRREVTAHEGQPVDLEVALTPIVPVRTEPAGVELVLDDKSVAIEEGGLPLTPRAHVLVARKPGHEERRIAIPAERPDGYAIDVVLKRVEPPPPPPPPPVGLTLRRKIAVGAGVVAVAGAVGGAVFGSQAQQRQDDANKLCPSPSSPCANAAQAGGLNASASLRGSYANIGFGVAAGAAITAAVLWFTGAPESRVAVAPRLGAVSGVDLAVRF